MNPLSTLIGTLERLRIPYVIGGSHASSARGLYRATQDVDIVAAVPPTQIDRLATDLGKDWYADREEMRSSIQSGRSFNLIYIPSADKFDFFPATNEFHACQLRRATPEDVQFAGETITCRVATAEDILLAILAANPSLDRKYLDHWAARLDVEELLARALREQP